MPKVPTHTNYPIIGRLHYTSKEPQILKSGMTYEQALEVLSKGLKEGWLDPYALIRRVKVKDTYKGVDRLSDFGSYYEMIEN